MPLESLFPRAPESQTTTDFVVTVFVLTVASILVLWAVAIIVGGLFGSDVSAYANTLADIVTTIIGALVGFIAGKSHGAAVERQSAAA